jgi:hypothetical protein
MLIIKNFKIKKKNREEYFRFGWLHLNPEQQPLEYRRLINASKTFNLLTVIHLIHLGLEIFQIPSTLPTTINTQKFQNNT